MRDFAFAGAPDYRTCRPRSTASSSASGRPGFPARDGPRGGADALELARRSCSAVPVPDLRRRPDRRRLRDGIAGPDLDPDRRRAACATRRPRDRPPVVLRDRRQRPGPPAVRRRGRHRLRRPLRARACAAPAAARPPGSTCPSTSTRRPATTRTSTSRAGTSSTTPRKRMGTTAFWAGIRDYLATNRFRMATTKSLLDTLDATHPARPGPPLFEPRFPGLLTPAPGPPARRRSAAAQRLRHLAEGPTEACGRQRRQPATSHADDGPLDAGPRAARSRPGRPAAAARSPATGSRRRRAAGSRASGRARRGRAAGGGRRRPGRGRVGPTWTGPSGPIIAAR